MIPKLLLILSACLIFTGCLFNNKPLPLPADEAEYTRPVQKSLKLTEPKKFKWNTVPADSIRPGHFSTFDINKLPSRPFNPGSMVPFQKPATQKAFDYSALPDTVLDLDKIPSEPLVYKISLLGTLKKSVLSAPKIRAESFMASFQYGSEQGLPGTSAQHVLQTKDGLLWISTSAELCIINGQSLDVLPFNYGTVYSMAEDRFGQVWVRSREFGIFVIDRKAGIQKQLAFPYGTHLEIDKNGTIWICSNSRGIYMISPDQKSFKHITRKNGLSSDHMVKTLEDNEGRIWTCNVETGIDILDLNSKKIKRLGKAQGLVNELVLGLAKNNSGDIYFAGYNNGIDVVNISKATWKHIDSAQGIKNNTIYNLLSDGEGRLWAGTINAGLFVISRNADSLINISSDDGLGDNSVLNLTLDNHQNMIVCTNAGGLNIFPPSGTTAHHITKKDGLIDNDVWGIFEDNKQRIWLGTYQGINIIKPDHRIAELLANPGGNNRTEVVIQTGPDQYAVSGFGSGLLLIDEARHTLERIGMKEGLVSNNIFELYQDKNGNLWMGTVDAGLMVFDPKKRTIRYLNQASGLNSNRVAAVIEDSTGKFWIGTGGGINVLDTSKNTIQNYTTKEGLSNDQLSAVVKDKKNRIWVSTERGLNLLDLAKNTNTVFSISSGMPANGVYSLVEKDGTIYAGTGKGLTVIKEKNTIVSGNEEHTWSLQSYGKPQGFPYLDFNGNSVFVTHDNQFWWGIIQGVTTLDESVLYLDSVKSPVQVTGLDILGRSQYFIDPGTIKNIDTVWTESKDSFYLAGSFGKLNSDRSIGIEWDSLSSTFLPENLSLPPDRNYLRFHFSNAMPQDEGDYKYRYILDGVDEKWSAVTEQPVSENYNNISPGYYSFRVSAKKGMGSWTQPTVYPVRIRPPWWKSWWAELIYVLIFIGLLRLWVTYRSRRLLKENIRLEQKVTDRTLELSSSLENLRQTQGQLIQAEKMASLGELTAGIAHEIQNPLNFVNNFSEVNTELLEDVNKALDEGDTPEAKEILKDVGMNMGKITFHGKRADAIVKGMLLHSRASSGQKIPTDVNALADEYLRLSYHGLRAKDKSFNATFNMEFDENTGQVMLVQQDIGRVLLNLFNNAFYSVTEKKKQITTGYQPTVSVSTKRKKDSIEIRIRDNGQGIPKKVIDKIYQPFFTTKPAGQGTGLGLSLSYDIITKEHSGKIDVVTKENEFTEFIIELPVQTAA
jgi:signal transduction histidine kinase/ligand-binding sensor domain-containing protein